jgi:BCD family chlorophyll transporter-like MFS transporter
MLLLGMVASGLMFGVLLASFSQVRLIQVIQGAGLLTMILNIVALWKQETRDPSRTSPDLPRPTFRESWSAFAAGGRPIRLLVAVGLGAAAFSMQDILLEPYGGQILHLAVGATTMLTALQACGGLAAFTMAAHMLHDGADPHRLAATGALVGVIAFAAVIFADPLESAFLFRIGAVLIGFGAGLFSVSTLTAAMGLERDGQSGMALGAWGAVQASAAGIAIALGGAIRDIVAQLAVHGGLGPALSGASVGYSVVYHLEIALLFATLVAIGPLVRPSRAFRSQPSSKFGLTEFPG